MNLNAEPTITAALAAERHDRLLAEAQQARRLGQLNQTRERPTGVTRLRTALREHAARLTCVLDRTGRSRRPSSHVMPHLDWFPG